MNLHKCIPFVLVFLFITISELRSDFDQLAQDAQKLEENQDFTKSAELYYRAGMEAWEKSALDKAVILFEKSVTINQQVGNKNALLNLYTNIGTIHVDLGQFETALFSYRKSLKIRQEMGDKSQIVSGQLNIASVLQEMGRNFEAITVTESALEIAKQINSLKLIRNCYGVLASNFKAVGEASQSMEYYNLYATFDKKIQAEEIQRKEADAELKVSDAKLKAIEAQKQKSDIEAQKQRAEQDLQNTEQDLYQSKKLSKYQESVIKHKDIELKIREERERQQKLLLTVYIVCLCLAAVSASVLILAYRKIKRKNTEISIQKEIILKQNIDTHNSLNYAKKIQKALLLPQSLLNEYLPESFIFFQPREEVSGDFYYFSNIEYLNTGKASADFNELLISAVDCTGHGVPGAFMSMIGFNLLDNIIANGTTSTNLILDQLNDGVHKSLKQSQTDNKDGMDMALLRIMRKQRIVQFSGAKNPVIYIQNGQLNEIKGCRSPIGGASYRGHEKFSSHEISCTVETYFYVFSDGFQDQFGGADGRKFMSKNFKQLLLDIHTRPFSEQKQLLEIALSDWRGVNRQIDDILVVGFKF